MSLFRNMSKQDLEQRLHDELCEKDKINEKMSQAFRQKSIADKAMTRLTVENGIIKEAYNDLREANRDIQPI